MQVAHELINAGHRCLDVRLASSTYFYRGFFARNTSLSGSSLNDNFNSGVGNLFMVLLVVG